VVLYGTVVKNEETFLKNWVVPDVVPENFVVLFFFSVNKAYNKTCCPIYCSRKNNAK